MNVKKKTAVEKISESEKTALYSISFENDGTTEFEKFVEEFEQNAKYNRDYQRIIAALQAILNLGSLERFSVPKGRLSILADNYTEHKIRKCKFVLNGTEKKISKAQDRSGSVFVARRVSGRAEPQIRCNDGGHRPVA